MKIRIKVDMTPVEMREFLGLPNVQPLQEEMLESLRRRMQSGIDDFDPVQMMRPFVAPDPAGMEAMQKAFWKSLSTLAPGADSTRAPQGGSSDAPGPAKEREGASG